MTFALLCIFKGFCILAALALICTDTGMRVLGALLVLAALFVLGGGLSGT